MLLELLFIAVVAAVTFMAARKVKNFSHSLMPGKEPFTIILIVWMLVTFFAYLFHSAWFSFDVLDLHIVLEFEVLVAMLFTIILAYPIGYSTGKVDFQNVAVYDPDTWALIYQGPVVYYVNKRNQLCVAIQTLPGITAAIFGRHTYLSFPFDKIRRRYTIQTTGEKGFLKIRLKNCVSVFPPRENPIQVPRRNGKMRVARMLTYFIGDHNTTDPVRFAVSSETYKDQTVEIASLNSTIAAYDVQRPRDIQRGGAEVFRSIAYKQLGSEIREEILEDLKAKDERDREEKTSKIWRSLLPVTPPEGESGGEGGDDDGQ